jgi:membrane protein insertase Oxa1/YidC/SpoIIIJ
MPIFVSFFLALRRMAETHAAEFQSGGILWFPDCKFMSVTFSVCSRVYSVFHFAVSLADPMYALPVLSGATFLAVVEVCWFCESLSIFYRLLLSVGW